MKSRTTNLNELLLMLGTLRQEASVTVSMLARKLGKDEGEVREIIADLLQVAVPPDVHGFPPLRISVHYSRNPDGENTLVMHGAGEVFDRALPLTAAEGKLLLLALDEFSSRLSDSESDALQGLRGQLSSATGGEPGEGGLTRARHGRRMREFIAVARNAIERSVKVRIDYYSGERSQLTEGRVVRPNHLLEQNGQVYLRGYCESRAAHRSFRIDRIRRLEVTDQRFDPGLMPVPGGGPAGGWDGAMDSGGKIRVRIRARIAEGVVPEVQRRGGEVKWLTGESLPDLPPDAWAAELTVPVYGPEWAVTWVLRHGANAELLEPAHLRTRLVERLDRMRAGMGGRA